MSPALTHTNYGLASRVLFELPQDQKTYIFQFPCFCKLSAMMFTQSAVTAYGQDSSMKKIGFFFLTACIYVIPQAGLPSPD